MILWVNANFRAVTVGPGHGPGGPDRDQVRKLWRKRDGISWAFYTTRNVCWSRRAGPWPGAKASPGQRALRIVECSGRVQAAIMTSLSGTDCTHCQWVAIPFSHAYSSICQRAHTAGVAESRALAARRSPLSPAPFLPHPPPVRLTPPRNAGDSYSSAALKAARRRLGRWVTVMHLIIMTARSLAKEPESPWARTNTWKGMLQCCCILFQVVAITNVISNRIASSET